MSDSPLERAMAALEELKTLPAAAGRSEAPGVVQGDPAGSTQAPGVPATAEGESTPAPVADDAPTDSPWAVATRAVVGQRVADAFGSLVVSERAVRAQLKESGVTVGVNEKGQPALALPDGTEHLLTAEGLHAAGIEDVLLKSFGKAGTGLIDTGSAPRPLTLEDGLRDSRVWQANQKLMLQLYAEYKKQEGR
jgi:hypothetical protein